MSVRALFWSRLRATLRNFGSLSIFLLALLVAIAMGWYSAERTAAEFRVAVVNDDQGELGERLIDLLSEDKQISLEQMDEKRARRLLRQDRLQCLFIIRPDFSQRLHERQFDGLVDLTVAPGCIYGASVSEPLVNTVMKLWFEEQTWYDLDQLLLANGIYMSSAQRASLQMQMEESWQSGAQIHVEFLMEESSAPSPLVADPAARIALFWYAALSPLFFILAGGWMAQLQQAPLQQRIAQSGMSRSVSFLSQAAAQLVMVLAGFVLVVMISGATSQMPALLPPILIYSLGLLGMGLLVCAACRELTLLLLIGPVFAMAAAFLSGLLIELPKWGQIWVIISHLLPGRYFYTALQGSAQPVMALLLSLGWLLAGLAISRWVGRRNVNKLEK